MASHRRVLNLPSKKYFDEFGNDVTHEVKTMLEDLEESIRSDPPTGKKKVTNIYWDNATQELVFDKEE